MRVIALSVPDADAELAADRLWVAGAGAVETVDRAGRTVLRTVLADVDDVSLVRLGPLSPDWAVTFEEVVDVPAQTWRRHATPMIVNDALVIRPAWLPPQGRQGVLEIEIEPGGSFGLGDHPTTRLCADATWRLTRAGGRVLDVGCGSGVLSVVAACRGAAEVVAIDVAEAAVEATRDNAARNGVVDRITASSAAIADVEGVFDLVVANVLAPPLVAMAGDLRRLTTPEGRLVVSGVLADHHGHVLEALDPMEVVATDRLEGWAVVELRHR